MGDDRIGDRMANETAGAGRDGSAEAADRPVEVGEAEIESMLAAHPLTEPLDPADRRTLSALVRVIDLESGEVLVHQGDVGDAAYLVVAGRMVATVDGRDMGVIGRGETVGEMALITDEARSATITARRWTRTLRLGAEDFAGVVAGHPEVHRRLNALLVERLRGTLIGRPAWVGHATVVGLAAVDSAAVVNFARRLERALAGQGGRVATIDLGHATHTDTPTDPRTRTDSATHTATATHVGPGDRSAVDDAMGHHIYELETHNDVVLVVTSIDRLVGPGQRFDRTLLLVDADGPIPPLPAGRLDDLVLQQPGHVELPTGTSRWLDALAPTRHHHVRRDPVPGADGDVEVDRLARRLLHRERVLVLGGGGARGLAHVGTYQALVASGIDFDAIVGVSAGAMFGAGMAMDWSPARSVEWSERTLIEGGRIIDFTVPMVALSSGRRLTEGLRDSLGEQVELEDLWRPLTCVSADLTSLTVRLDQRGPLWMAVRASVSVPGVFPPLLVGDAVLVDGGVIDNLPVDRARQLHPGATIISSDVGRRHEPLNVDLPAGGIVGGWQTTWDRVGRRRDTTSMVKLLYRLTALGGGATSQSRGEVHIEHVLDGIGLFDFGSARPAIDAGYERTMAVLARSDCF